MRDQVNQYLRAGYPCIWIQDWEEDRVCDDLKNIAEQGKGSVKKLGYYEWTCTQGFYNFKTKTIEKDTTDPIAALKFVKESKDADQSLFVFKNMHFFLDNPNSKHLIIQWIKDLIPISKSKERHLIFISSQVTLPAELSKDIAFLQLDLPDAKALDAVFEGILESVSKAKTDSTFTSRVADLLNNMATNNLIVTEEQRYLLVQAAVGLTCSEAENAFALTWVEYKSFSHPEAVSFVQKLKTKFINSSGILEYIPPKFSLDDIGGLDELKRWLVMYQKAFTKEAAEFGLATPKGVICTGQPGTGKSTAANATSAAWNIPLLRFDIGQIFGSLLGETEQKLRTVLRTAEALAPCILQIEEIEKSLAGISGGNTNDGGTTSRVGATLLTWMQEKTKPVFVFATANDISKLDSALVRKGRFDEIFFIDLPTFEERSAIFEIHLRKRKRIPEDFDIKSLATHSEGYGGAEIESAIESALWSAFNDGKRALNTHDVLHALASTRPVSITKKETIEGLRNWAEGRARNASSVSNEVQVEHVEENYNNLRKIAY